MDITTDESKTLMYRHESYQLWESDIQGILLQHNCDFISVNRDGIHVISLGSEHNRHLVDGTGRDRMLHSLESVSYLKVDDSNYINFATQNMQKREIHIMQEYYTGDFG
jgi:hypothetical protein